MFITFEGIDGSGKTTQSELLYSYITYDLQKKGKCYLTSEPYNDTIREILTTDIPEKSKLHIFLADRYQHIEEIIQPKLKEGAIIICDRYEDSTVAYQYYGNYIYNTIDYIKLCNFIQPDLTFLLTIDINKSIDRIIKRDNKYKINNKEYNKKYKNIQNGYLELSKINKNRYIVIDGDNTEETIHKQILKEFLKRYNNKENSIIWNIL